jgi:adenylate kinase family enzyme
LIGPAGSGKTTHTEFLRKRFGIPTVTVDDLIQANPAALAKYRCQGITAGPPQLKPAVDGLLAEQLSSLDLSKGLALDGYPAGKDQAGHLSGETETASSHRHSNRSSGRRGQTAAQGKTARRRQT